MGRGTSSSKEARQAGAPGTNGSGLATLSADPASGTMTEGRLSPAELLEFYKLMYESRRIDDREILLKRQQKIFFQVSAAGHEALQAAMGKALRSGYDWVVPYYRDRTLCLALGRYR